MAGDEDTSIEWLERDSREWVVYAIQSDQVTARVTCTYLETGGVEARVGTHSGHYCVEVPANQLETAFTIYTPPDSGILPAVEVNRKTGIHTGVHLRKMLKQANTESEAPAKRPMLKWLLRLVVLTVLAGLLLLFFTD